MKRKITYLLFSIITISFVLFVATIRVNAEEKIILTVDVNGGIEIEPSSFEIEKGSILNDIIEEYKLDSDLIKHEDSSKILDGFTNLETEGTKYNGDEVIEEDTTIYANWVDDKPHTSLLLGIETHSVTFVLNGGECTTCEEQVVADMTTANKPDDPTMLNYNFIGWYTDEGLTNAFDFDTKLTEDIILYAKYEFVESVSLTSSVKSVNFGSTYVGFKNNILKTIKLKNTGNVSIKININIPESHGPFGVSDFEANHVLAPDEEYIVTLIGKSGGLNYNKVGVYTGNYVFNAESESGGQAEAVVNAKISVENPDVKVSYTTHVQNVGWQNYVSNGAMAGTQGRSLRLEAIKIKLENSPYSGNIEYKTHIQNIGWESGFKINNQISGTSGRSLRLEAIEIKLTGEISKYYDVYYRVHAQNFGWLGWAKNGEQAGTAGYSYRLEGIEIRLVSKNTKFSEYGNGVIFYDKTDGAITPIVSDSLIAYTTHVQNIGWQRYSVNGEMAGTQGQSLRLEGIRIKLLNQLYSGDIEYRTHIQNIGWESTYRSNYEMSGTSGRSLRLEAIQIRLTGEMADHYDVYYRVHAQNFGWLGWARNGEQAGTAGYSYRLEGIEIRLVEKGKVFSEYGGTIIFIDSKSGVTIPNKDGSVDKGWKNIDGNVYYYYEDGTKATYIKTIGGVRYEFSKDGVLQNSKFKILADISYHNGDIDFDTLWNSGEIDGIILRVGYSRTLDLRFTKYLSEIKRLGIPYSVYHFSYAENVEEAQKEANSLISWYETYNLNPTMGVFYDIEDWVTSRSSSDHISVSDYDSIIDTYVSTLNNRGINVSLYTGKNYAETRLSAYGRSLIGWIAQYANNCTYQGSYRGWQYTSKGTLPGINGNVDLSMFYY